jgi:hypothetical protein
MSYVLPVNELTLASMSQFRMAAIEAGIFQALAHGLAAKREELIVRALMPATDLGAATGWAQEQYRNPAIAAAGWGSIFDTGALPAFAPTLANSKVAVFYKFANYSAAPSITALRFRVGGNGASTRGMFNLQLDTGAKLEPDVYFSEPVVYEPQDVVYIEAYYGVPVAALGENFAFGAYIIERAGANIS